MLKIGDHAPDFTAQATTGSTVSLAAHRGRPVGIYFFPKAFTMGCTVETRRFCDNYEQIRKLGAEIIGIAKRRQVRRAMSSARRQQGAVPARRRRGPSRICEAFGVLWPLIQDRRSASPSSSMRRASCAQWSIRTRCRSRGTSATMREVPRAAQQGRYLATGGAFGLGAGGHGSAAGRRPHPASWDDVDELAQLIERLPAPVRR